MTSQELFDEYMSLGLNKTVSEKSEILKSVLESAISLGYRNSLSLINAAPDLLYACEKSLELASQHWGASGDSELFDILNEAIIKAKGQ